MQFETPEMKRGGHVEILVDSNLIEVFVNDGEYVISNAVYGIGNEIVSDRKVIRRAAPGQRNEQYCRHTYT